MRVSPEFASLPAMNPLRDRPGRTYPTFAAEIIDARAQMDAPAEIALAIRADRARRGLSQRAFAEAHGLTKSFVARLESDPMSIPLGKILEALAMTGHTLRLATSGRGPATCPTVPNTSTASTASTAGGSNATASWVDPDNWATAELIARDRANRRFPTTMSVSRSTGGSSLVSYRWFRYGGNEPPWRARRTFWPEDRPTP